MIRVETGFLIADHLKSSDEDCSVARLEVSCQ